MGAQRIKYKFLKWELFVETINDVEKFLTQSEEKQEHIIKIMDSLDHRDMSY